MKISKRVILFLLLLAAPGYTKELYCQTNKSDKSKVYLKISGLPDNMTILMSTLPQLLVTRAPANEQMNKIMDSYFEGKREFAFSVKIDKSSYDEIKVKPLLAGELNGQKSVAFMTNPFAKEKIIKFQLHTNSNQGILDYSGANGTHNKVNLDCSSEKSSDF